MYWFEAGPGSHLADGYNDCYMTEWALFMWKEFASLRAREQAYSTVPLPKHS